MTVASLVVRVSADLSELRKIRQGVARAIEPVRQQLKSVGTAMSTYVTAPLAGVGAAAVKVASDVEEMRGKFETVFGALSKETEAWAAQHAKAVGRSKYDLMGYAAQLQDTFVPMGVARGEAAGLSKAMAQLAVDLASFNNANEAETVELLTSALVGNHEAVRRFGVVITQATLDQELLNMGIEGGAKAASEQEKMFARMNLMMRSTKDAQGDAARTSGSFANQMRALQAVVKDVAVEIGEILLPEARKLVSWARGAMERFKGLDPSIKRVIVVVGGLAAAIGPVLLALGSLSTLLPVLASGFALLVGPIGIATALAGAAYLIYENWEGVSGFFQDLWERVSRIFSAAKELLLATLAGLWPKAQRLFLEGIAKLYEPLRRFLDFLGAGEMAAGITAFQGRLAGLVPEAAIQENAARITELKGALFQEFGDVARGVSSTTDRIASSVKDMAGEAKAWLLGEGGLAASFLAAASKVEAASSRVQAGLSGVAHAVSRMKGLSAEALTSETATFGRVKTELEKLSEGLGVGVPELREVNGGLETTTQKAREAAGAVRGDLGSAFEDLSRGAGDASPTSSWA